MKCDPRQLLLTASLPLDLTLRQPPTPQEEAFKILKKALETGANFWNAGQIYGPKGATSLELLKAYFTKYPEDKDKVVISVKSCFDFANYKMHCDAASVKQYMDNCLAIADGKYTIDVFEPARIDPNVPVEETIGAIAEYVKAGKIGGIGLSEVNADIIQKAVKVHPIAAVEVELSMFSTEVLENGTAKACKDHNIPLVAYSPLSRGFLTGGLRKYEDMDENDYRRRYPRFSKENFGKNVELVEKVEEVAKKHGYTVPQVAIGWVSSLNNGPDTGVVIPIPGATGVPRAEENSKAVKMSDAELKDINELVKSLSAVGGRYPGH